LPSTKLYTATIRSHRPAGRGYYRLILKAPDIAASAVPGQFVMVRVTDTMDPLLARPLGIHSVPSKTSLEILYRVVGRGTELLSRRKVGSTLTVLGPLGKGFPLPDKERTPVLIGGGSGFPPLHFLSLRAGARAHLFLGSRNRECLPPVSVIKSFSKRVEKVHIATEDGSSGRRGMSTDMLESFLNRMEHKTSLVLYACGPHGMLAAVSRIAAEHSLPCFVSMEERMACGLGACMGCSIPVKTGGYQRVCKEGPVFDSREIDWAEKIRLELPKREVKN
jgi:dihydroorotate dehydrogenase electron transfer subunit